MPYIHYINWSLFDSQEKNAAWRKFEDLLSDLLTYKGFLKTFQCSNVTILSASCLNYNYDKFS